MVPSSGVTKPHRPLSNVTAFPHQCELCGGRRSAGSTLASQPDAGAPMLWVCDDCQHKLARRVDDEGVLGG